MKLGQREGKGKSAFHALVGFGPIWVSTMKIPNQIENEFIVLDPDKKASIEQPDSSLYPRIEKTYNGFAGCELISCYEFEADWSSWEVHPHGDEIVMLMSGEVTFVLENPDGQTSITLLEQGHYIIVPKGTWHTAKTKGRSKVLFITPGQGTQHKSDN